MLFAARSRSLGGFWLLGDASGRHLGLLLVVSSCTFHLLRPRSVLLVLISALGRLCAFTMAIVHTCIVAMMLIKKSAVVELVLRTKACSLVERRSDSCYRGRLQTCVPRARLIDLANSVSACVHSEKEKSNGEKKKRKGSGKERRRSRTRDWYATCESIHVNPLRCNDAGPISRREENQVRALRARRF